MVHELNHRFFHFNDGFLYLVKVVYHPNDHLAQSIALFGAEIQKRREVGLRELPAKVRNFR